MLRINGFQNEERMLDVRTKYLNPLIEKVERNLDPRVTSLETEMSQTIKDVELDVNGGGLVFKKTHASDQFVDITPLIPEYKGIGVEDASGGGVADGVHLIKFPLADVSSGGKGIARVSYNWDSLVKTYQRDLAVKTGPDPADIASITGIRFTGDQSKVSVAGSTLNFEIPSATPMLKASINTGADQIIDKINITGDTTSTEFDGTTLKIHLPKEGSGGGITNQNFKGFFETLGDIESQVTDAISGKSYAFAKDSTLGGSYYTPYFYVNTSWTELKQDPALVYSATTATTPQGVFSITPDDRITIDSNGQLNLSNLGVDESKLHFHGFFPNQAALDTAVTKPVLDRSFAYIRHANNAWIGKTYLTTTAGPAWQIMAPISAISLVDSQSSSTVPSPLYGFYNNEMITIDGNGLATINGKVEQTIKINVLDKDGEVKTGDVTALQFMAGESYVTLQGKKAFIQHPQRLIQYNADFESEHNTNDYMGNIFYDQTSRSWMGWGIPDVAGGVDVKWTRIAHPHMSQEVKGLSLRSPAKAPYVVPGILGDSTRWEFNSWTYVEKDDSTLPDEFGTRCGAYISTVVQDVDNDTQRPQERLQICYADEPGGHCYVRTWDKGTGSAGAAGLKWRPWVKISMSGKDIDAHNENPDAHTSHHKYYKVCTFETLYNTVKTNAYRVEDRGMYLIADNYGSSNEGEQYTSIPYNGSFKLSGMVDVDGWENNAPKVTDWLVTIFRVRNSVETKVAEFAYKCSLSTNEKKVKPFKWKTDPLPFEYGDKVVYKVQCVGDTDFATKYKILWFPIMRNFFVIEDARTSAGSRIAETQRRTSGIVNSQFGTGINVHFTNRADASGGVRLYGTTIEKIYQDMSKVRV